MTLYQLTRNGQRIFAGDEDSCYMKLQRSQSNSSSHAIRFDGYKISPFECSDEEAAAILKADPYHPIEVYLVDDLKSFGNHSIKVRLESGEITTANTMGMTYPNGISAGSKVLVMQMCLSHVDD